MAWPARIIPAVAMALSLTLALVSAAEAQSRPPNARDTGGEGFIPVGPATGSPTPIAPQPGAGQPASATAGGQTPAIVRDLQRAKTQTDVQAPAAEPAASGFVPAAGTTPRGAPPQYGQSQPYTTPAYSGSGTPQYGSYNQGYGQQPSRPQPDPTIPLEQIQKAWDQPVSAPGQRRPGIRPHELSRDPKRRGTMTVVMRQYFATLITLPACEKIEDIILGDGYVFSVEQPRDNEIALTAAYYKADTNLLIRGSSGTHYVFYLRVVGTDSPTITDSLVPVEVEGLCDPRSMIARGTANGAPGQQGGGDPLKRDYLTAVPFDRRDLNCHAYAVFVEREADKALAPDSVCTDGIFVYLDYGQRIRTIRVPGAYLTIDNVDEPVVPRFLGDNGEIMAVQAGAGADITLKSGSRVVCIRRKHGIAFGGRATIDPNLGLRK